ncbi:MAG TPA: hypothetical protein VGP07_11285 [Polyangia bacterium]
MKIVSEEQRAFEAMQPELVRSHPGQFAVLCGSGLMGIFETVDEALLASSREFDAGKLPEGAPIFISEIAERVSLRVTARPFTAAETRDRASTAGEIQV